MKTGKYLTIKKAFRAYKANKRLLAEYPAPDLQGVDYSKSKIVGDNTKNGSESMVIAYLDAKERLEGLIKLVDEVVRWFTYEGYGRERYIKLCMIDGNTPLWSCSKIGVDVRTGYRWQRDIYDKAEMIAEGMNLWR